MFVVLALVVAGRGDDYCRADLNGVYPAVVTEYSNAVHSMVERRRPHNRRRSLETEQIRYFPFSELNFVGHPGVNDKKIIQQAWQYASMLYTVNETDTPLSLTLITNATPPAQYPTVIGMYDGTDVYIYVSRITSNDMLFLVTIHELFHWLAFYSVDVGHGSFVTRTSPEKVYNGPRVGPCVNNVTVRTDDFVAHWRNDEAPFIHDVMEPILPSSGDAQISVCTTMVVVETRTNWTLMSCNSDPECPVNHSCVGTQPHLAGTCIHTNSIILVESEPAKAPIRQFPKLTAFIFGVFTALNLVAQCARRKPTGPASSALKPSHPGRNSS